MALGEIGDVFGIIKSCVRGIHNGDTQERVYKLWSKRTFGFHRSHTVRRKR